MSLEAAIPTLETRPTALTATTPESQADSSGPEQPPGDASAQYTPVPEGIGPGPPCPADASCAGGFAFDGAVYNQSCGALDPAEVEPEPLAEAERDGQPLAVHAVRGTDPALLVAIRPLHCEAPLDLGPDGFHLAFQRELALGPDGPTDAFNVAICRAALFGTDPAEGFRCVEATPTSATASRG